MKRAVILTVLLATGSGAAALAQAPAPEHVPPPPQTQGQLNSMAAKHPAKPETMRPLASAAQATPRKHVAAPKPKATGVEQKAAPAQRKPNDR